MSEQLARIEAVAGRDVGRPIIDLDAGGLPRVVREAAAALQAAGAPIYLHGGRLVRTLRLDQPEVGQVRRPVGAVVLTPVTPDWIRLKIGEAAECRRWRSRERDWRPCDPPLEVARGVIASMDELGWRPLRTIVRHPVLFPDGSYMPAGYRAGVLVDTSGEWPEPSGSLEEAEAALATLRNHVRYMPWAGRMDESVALAGLLTAVMRPVLPAAPMVAYDAPTPGTGKSLLADVGAILATGGPAAVMDWGRDPAEADKRLAAMLLASDPFIALDNVEAALEGAGLCQTLTQAERRIRVLGGHEVVTVPCAATIIATGNNLVIRGDLVRRAVVCRLDARSERPELRSIDQDLLAETHARRPELVAAVQSVVAAYIAAGSPDVGLSQLGSYRAWSALVRAPLVWLGLPDPAASMDRLREDDPGLEASGAVLSAWHRHYRGNPATAADAIGAAANNAELGEALAEVATRRGNLDTRALGYWLRAHRDARVAGLALRREPGRKTPHRWYVEQG